MSVGGGDVHLPRPPGMPDDADDYEAAVRKQEQRETDEDTSESTAESGTRGDGADQRPQGGLNEPLDQDDQPGEFGGAHRVAPAERGDTSNT